MTATVSWYTEGRIVIAKLAGILASDEIEPLNQTVAQYVREGQAPVHLIVDALELDKFPVELRKFGSTRLYMREPNMGKIAVLTHQSVIVRFFASVVSQAAHIELKMFDTLDAGLAFLKRVDGTL